MLGVLKQEAETPPHQPQLTHVDPLLQAQASERRLACVQGGGSPQQPITDLLARLSKAGKVQERLQRMPPQDLPKPVARVSVQAFGSEGAMPAGMPAGCRCLTAFLA